MSKINVPSFNRLKALVVGDIMVDEYVVGENYRMSNEAPVPILKVDSFEVRLGGAANVANNLRLLGCQVELSGIVGSGRSGVRCEKLLAEANIGTQSLVYGERSITTTKTRVLINNYQVVRYDYENTELNNDERALIHNKLSGVEDDFDFIVVSDYAKGVISGHVMDLLRRIDKPIFVDPKPQNKELYDGIFCMTPNKEEFVQMSGGDSQNHALRMLEELNLKYLVVTCGGDGCYVYQFKREHIQCHKRDIVNEIGAGDTFISVFAAVIMSGLDLKQAAEMANVAAGIGVTKKYTNVCSFDELDKAWRSNGS